MVSRKKLDIWQSFFWYSVVVRGLVDLILLDSVTDFWKGEVFAKLYYIFLMSIIKIPDTLDEDRTGPLDPKENTLSHCKGRLVPQCILSVWYTYTVLYKSMKI